MGDPRISGSEIGERHRRIRTRSQIFSISLDCAVDVSGLAPVDCLFEDLFGCIGLRAGSEGAGW
jgi:hypothetical protein